MELTKKQIADYRKNPDHCPYCDSDDWGAGSWQAGLDDVSQTIVCFNCGFEWDNVYTLTSIDWADDQDPKK